MPGRRALVRRPRDVDVPHFQNVESPVRGSSPAGSGQVARLRRETLQRGGGPHDQLGRLGLILGRPNEHRLTLAFGSPRSRPIFQPEEAHHKPTCSLDPGSNSPYVVAAR